ncbi:hypothetical protein AB0A91_34800 [Streptomyces sp. NPDC042207]
MEPDVVEGQNRGIRELSRRAFPELENVLDGQLTPIETARV